MSPEKINELADWVDPKQLWRLSGLEQMKLHGEERKQLDAGVYLRRHAAHIAELRQALKDGKSLLITPLSESGITKKFVELPEDHARLRDLRSNALASGY